MFICGSPGKRKNAGVNYDVRTFISLYMCCERKAFIEWYQVWKSLRIHEVYGCYYGRDCFAVIRYYSNIRWNLSPDLRLSIFWCGTNENAVGMPQSVWWIFNPMEITARAQKTFPSSPELSSQPFQLSGSLLAYKCFQIWNRKTTLLIKVQESSHNVVESFKIYYCDPKILIKFMTQYSNAAESFEYRLQAINNRDIFYFYCKWIVFIHV